MGVGEDKKKRKKKNQTTFTFIAQHELLLEPKSEKRLENSPTRDSHALNEVFYRGLKAQQLHKHNPETSVSVTVTCPPPLY